MNFSKSTFKKTFLAFCLATPFFIAACGSDSGSSSDDFGNSIDIDEDCDDDSCDSKSSGSSDSNGASSSSFKKKEADISANSYMDSSAIGTQFNSKMGTMNILEGTLYDSTYNREYRTVTIGAYTWIAENIDEAITAFQDYDMCYDNSAANCKTDGRLFRNYTKDNMCPGNFTVPSSADYRYLLQVSSQLTDANLGFNPQMAGFCRENSFKADSSGCFDREKKSYLLTNDDSLFVIDASGKAGMAKPESYGFYSLRCVKMSSIVDTEKQLPTCNLKGNVSRSMFVASEGVNYTCKDGKWSKQTDKSCYSRGEKHYYNDKLYICNGSWELATMEETGAECSENNQNEVRELNGVKYICDDSTWRKPNATENSIGICTSDKIGTLDTIPAGQSLDFYYCDSTGWRTARLVDYVGKCDSSKFYNIVEFGETKYACRTDRSWKKLSTTETKIGLCTPTNYGVIDSVKQGELYDQYFCDSTGWRAAKLVDYAGKCDDSKFYSTIDFGTVSYACRTDSSWTKLSTTETKIGVCSPKNRGAIDSINSIIYVCDTTDWKVATIYDIFECSSAKINSTVKFKDNTYGCNDDLQWTPVTDTTKALGYCTSKNYGTIKKYSSTDFICDTEWRKATQNDLIGLCNDSTEGTITTYNGEKYGCAKKTWRTLKAHESEYGMCTIKNAGEIHQYRIGEFFKCTGSSWDYVSIGNALGECNSTTVPSLQYYAGGAYFCVGYSWKPAKAHSILGACTSKRKNETGYVGDTLYICNGVTDWVKYTGPEEEYGLCTNNTDRIIFNGEKYGCTGDTGAFEWRRENDLDRELGFCNGADSIQWKELDGVDYVCSLHHLEWFTGTFVEMYEDCAIHNENHNFGTTVGYKGETYYCQEGVVYDTGNSGYEFGYWHKMNSFELEYGLCTPENQGQKVTIKNYTYTCSSRKGRDESIEYTIYSWIGES